MIMTDRSWKFWDLPERVRAAIGADSRRHSPSCSSSCASQARARATDRYVKPKLVSHAAPRAALVSAPDDAEAGRMSERSGAGFGAFPVRIVLGAVAGFRVAPTEGGESTRRKGDEGLRNLKELPKRKVDEVRGPVAGSGGRRRGSRRRRKKKSRRSRRASSYAGGSRRPAAAAPGRHGLPCPPAEEEDDPSREW